MFIPHVAHYDIRDIIPSIVLHFLISWVFIININRRNARPRQKSMTMTKTTMTTDPRVAGTIIYIMNVPLTKHLQ